MELTLAEIERILSISRHQVSRYATDGRLVRTRQGHYDAASLANLHPPFDPWARQRGESRDEARAIWLVRAEHAFRRELRGVIARRCEAAWRPGHPRPTPAASEGAEVERSVKAYTKTLATMPDR